MAIATHFWQGIRLTLVLWLLTVVAITLPLLLLAQLVAPEAANGSLVHDANRVVGSRLIGQPFSAARYLQGRPGDAPDLAFSSPELSKRIAATAQRWQRDGVNDPAADLLQDSASGVDPHISLAAARQQLPGLARARELPLVALEQLLHEHQAGPGALQAIEPVVNVLDFNLALDALKPIATRRFRTP